MSALCHPQRRKGPRLLLKLIVESFAIFGAQNDILFNSYPKRVDPRDIASDDQRVDVVRSFVRGDTFKVHHVANHRVAISNPCGAEYVPGFACALQGHPNIVAFGHRNLCRTRRARFHEARETQCQQLRFRDFLRHPDKFLLHQLETGNRTAELFARLIHPEAK